MELEMAKYDRCTKKKKKNDEIYYLLCSVPISFTSYDTTFKLYNEMNPLLIQANCL